MTAEVPSGAGPVGESERIQLLDIVRGFALFGVLMGNLIWTGPHLALSDAAEAALPTASIDWFANWLWTFLGHDKANTLFAFLFGLGFAIQLERGERRESRFVLRFARRLGVLLLFGLVHNFFLWFGDILHLYALTGFLLIPARRWSNRTLLVAGLLFALCARPAFDFGKHAIPAVDAYVETLPDPYSDGAVAERQALLLSGSYRDMLRANYAITREDWIDNGSFLPWIGYVFGRFLLGYWAGRNRFLEDAARFRAGWLRLFRVALPIGLVSCFYRATKELLEIELSGFVDLVSDAFQQIGTLALAASYVAALVLLYLGSARWKPRLARLAPVGRMALTNYLAQSLLYLFGLYGLGLGLIDNLGASGMWLLGISFFALQIALSSWWLSRFTFGPMEWLWRALTYGNRPPFRRARSGSRTGLDSPGST